MVPIQVPCASFFSLTPVIGLKNSISTASVLDATQNMYDSSEKHILRAITERVRRAGAGRSTLVIGENEPQDTQIVRSAHEGGYGMDGVWNDDFHHSAIVALTARREAYYNDYTGKPQEFISAAKRGFLYQGQHYRWQKKRR